MNDLRLPGSLGRRLRRLGAIGAVAFTSTHPVAGQVLGMHGDAVHQAGPFAGAAVGTARAPASEPMPGQLFDIGAWSVMAHGFLNVAGRRDTGPRGGDDLFLSNMLMGHARRPLGPAWLEVQAMVSAEPLLGPSGYGLLFQTGETADGVNSLVDRQHPHDFIMGLSASVRWEVEPGAWAFLYAAPVGSPALGPVPFMHRLSGMANPVAPISHHFLDAAHISWGVLTGGVATELLQVEVSWFNGHEPDEDRWAPEGLDLNSFAGRVTVTPGPAWALQASFGALDEPEQLHPAVDMYRVTLSATYHRPLAGGWWATTAAFGRNTKRETTMTLGEARARLPGPLFDHYVGSASLPPDADDSLRLLFERRVQGASLVESAWRSGRATAFVRWERARKDELFRPADPRHSAFFTVTKAQAGAVVDILDVRGTRLGVGASGAIYWFDDELDALYESGPRSGMFFLRLVL